MKSLEQIRKESAEAAQRAAEERREPLIAFEDGDDAVFGAPFLGDYVPEGWTLVRKYFVDGSGFGAPGEPALTAKEFLRKVKGGRGYAILEAGQFQVFVGEYTREEER